MHIDNVRGGFRKLKLLLEIDIETKYFWDKKYFWEEGIFQDWIYWFSYWLGFKLITFAAYFLPVRIR